MRTTSQIKTMPQIMSTSKIILTQNTKLSIQAQNLCIDASVEQSTKVNKGKQSQGLLKSMKSLRTFESYEKV